MSHFDTLVSAVFLILTAIALASALLEFTSSTVF